MDHAACCLIVQDVLAIVNNPSHPSGSWATCRKPASTGALRGAPRSRTAERQAGECCRSDMGLSTMALGFGAQSWRAW